MKNLKIFILLIVVLGSVNVSSAQKKTLVGVVSELNERDSKSPLYGVSIYWAETTIGVSTDISGHFEIPVPENTALKLVVSFVGYVADTINVKSPDKYLDIILNESRQLKEVVISEREVGAHLDRINPIATQVISGAELKKAACCNLSESFETNASVDVSFSDALTGAKQIQLLGLKGTYVQLQTENLPNIRGLASTYGLGYIPGDWMESIQLSKGAGSVVNGYESLTGQINVEYKKPDSKERFFVNVYGNHAGKGEANINGSVKLSEKVSTMILAHVENLHLERDKNEDSFLDIPMVTQYNVFNRWKYRSEKFVAQAGFKFLSEERNGGQLSFDHSAPRNEANGYGIGIKTTRYEAFIKSGYIFADSNETSIAFLSTASLHDQNSFFGLRDYDANQSSAYANLTVQSGFSDEKHKINAGIDFKYDKYVETLDDLSFWREEVVPGVYYQHTWHFRKILTILAGFRFDYHNKFGAMYTPRLHIKYDINEKTRLRASAGRGYRTPNSIAENSYILMSSRTINFVEEPLQEEAWNYGVSFIRDFVIKNKKTTINAEFFRTDFVNQLVVDMDADVSQVRIYNLDGKSYSNNFQVEINSEILKGIEATLAFRYSDVKTTINDNFVAKPLVNKYKGLLTLSYITKLKKWQFDYTLQLNGDGRLPSTTNNPLEYQRPDTYPAYMVMNAQVTKYFRKWDIYLGVENLTNYKQNNPIIAADDPFGNYFDSSMIWGPLMGRMFYLGIRYTIKKYD